MSILYYIRPIIVKCFRMERIYNYFLNVFLCVVFTLQDYAANTMNELLAIYGYDEKVDKSVTEDLQLQDFSEDKKGKDDGCCSVFAGP